MKPLLFSFLILLSQITAYAAVDGPVMGCKITGQDEGYQADVKLEGGIKRLATTSTVTVDQILGLDNQADTWTTVNSCTNGGSITVHIAAGPSGPAISKVIPLTSTNKYTCTEQVVTALNADTTFAASFAAEKIKDNAIFHITSLFIGEYGERPNSGDYYTTYTGASTLDAWDNIIRRRKTNSLARDPRDHRIGTFGVTGTVSVIPGGIGKRYLEYFKSGGSSDMRVNGSVTPVVFTVPISATEDIYINQVRCFGGANGIKFAQFIGLNTKLTNGLLVQIKSDDQALSLPAIKSTEDFKNIFSFPGPTAFRIDVQSGADQFIAVYDSESAFILKRSGSIPTDDYVKITVRDDIRSAGSQLECLAEGFRAE